MGQNSFSITVYVPAQYSDRVRMAMGEAGAGQIGDYKHCSFTIKGEGRFMPGPESTPHTGQKGIVNVVEEDRITVSHVPKDDLEAVIEAIRSVHPYEEPAIEIYELFSL